VNTCDFSAAGAQSWSKTFIFVRYMIFSFIPTKLIYIPFKCAVLHNVITFTASKKMYYHTH